MKLRRALPQEAAAIGDLTVTAYAGFTLGPVGPYVEELRDAAARERGAELWVAVDGPRLLGTVTYCPPGSPWREIAGDHEGEFRMLAVHPDARGRRVGTALTALCEERARGHGASAMVLSTLAQMSAARRVYDRLGYIRLPHRDWEPLPGVRLIAHGKELT